LLVIICFPGGTKFLNDAAAKHVCASMIVCVQSCSSKASIHSLPHQSIASQHQQRQHLAMLNN